MTVIVTESKTKFLNYYATSRKSEDITHYVREVESRAVLLYYSIWAEKRNFM